MLNSGRQTFSTSMAENPFNISLAQDNATLFQLYCVKPPSDSCAFGPCPNPDVTGFGQQVSLYITATVFAITLVHKTDNFRSAWYGYVANIYSLLIATSLSIAQGQLTEDDAVFVLVAVASPATIYLWYLSATQVMQRGTSGSSSLTRMRKWEKVILLIPSSCLFLFWIALFPVILIPMPHIKLSQKACNKDVRYYNGYKITQLAWTIFYISNWAWPAYMRRRLRRINKWQQNVQLIHEHPGVQWIRESIKKACNRYGHLLLKHPNLVLFLTLMNQLMTYTVNTPYASWGIEFVVLACILYSVVNDILKCRVSPGVADTLLFIVFIGLCAATPWTHIPPTSCITLILWGLIVRDISGRSERTHKILARIIFLAVCTPPTWMRLSPTRPDFTGGSAIVSIIVSLIIMGIISYYGPYTSPGFENFPRMWFEAIHSSPAFKCVILVIGPSLAWISVTLQANPVKTSSSSFGQIYALMTSIASLSSLIVEIYDRRKEFVANFWFVNEAGSSGNGLPMPETPQALPDPPDRPKPPHRSRTL